MGYVALQIFLNKPTDPNRKINLHSNLFPFSFLLGFISTLVSIGGGSISVPYLLRHNISITQAIGTSAALGIPISIAGSFAYFILGNFFNTESTHTYIYFPAVIIISISSMLFIPLGIKLGYSLPVKILKKCFAVLLFILSIKMIFMVIS